MTLVEAENLTLPSRLEATSLRIMSGELTCLIGPNGSGKTSLLHALAGIGRRGGVVRIDGTDPSILPPSRRQKMLTFLPASRDVAWPLTAGDVIALGGGVSAEEIDTLLAELGLREFADRRIDRMSTGERSRVLIARALAAKPRLLLLDEPVSNLDPYWQLRLMAQLRAEARANEQAMLVALHDLELARAFADRLIIMQDGQIVADGDAQSLLAGPDVPRVFGIAKSEAGWRPVA